LHEFFAGWFNGDLPDTDAEFARVAEVLHPSFAMIVPSGQVLDRTTVLVQLRAAHGTADASAPVRIEIRDLVVRVADDDTALVTYEEWQFAGDRMQGGRVSSAYFVRDAAAPKGVVWRHLHEAAPALD
jgi:hypothetical protein